MALRIIAGEFRRRKLRTNPGLITRPITDRMKETLFERLGAIDDLRVADIFAGTGTLGLEALSRGAASAVFFEQDRKAWELLRANIDALQASDRAFCWRVDVRRTSFKPRGEEQKYPYSLIFFDPPYKLSEDLREGRSLSGSLGRLAKAEVTADRATLVLRTPNEKPLHLPGEWIEQERLVISSSRISICTKGPSKNGPLD